MSNEICPRPIRCPNCGRTLVKKRHTQAPAKLPLHWDYHRDRLCRGSRKVCVEDWPTSTSERKV